MDGILLLGLILMYSGLNWSSLPILMACTRYGSPSSSSMIEILRPFGVVQVYRSIISLLFRDALWVMGDAHYPLLITHYPLPITDPQAPCGSHGAARRPPSSGSRPGCGRFWRS